MFLTPSEANIEREKLIREEERLAKAYEDLQKQDLIIYINNALKQKERELIINEEKFKIFEKFNFEKTLKEIGWICKINKHIPIAIYGSTTVFSTRNEMKIEFIEE